MKFRKPSGVPEPSGNAAPVSRRTGARKPEWLREWIADQGVYVLLSCGHKENLNDRALLIIARLDGTYVICERCNDMAAVVRHMQFREYANIPAIAESSIPLF